MKPRPELFTDIAEQFDRMEQPLNLLWMQTRSVSLEEVTEVSRVIAAAIRAHCGLPGITIPRTVGLSETVLGRRQENSTVPDDEN